MKAALKGRGKTPMAVLAVGLGVMLAGCSSGGTTPGLTSASSTAPTGSAAPSTAASALPTSPAAATPGTATGAPDESLGAGASEDATGAPGISGNLPVVGEQTVTNNGAKIKVSLRELKPEGDIMTMVATLENVASDQPGYDWFGNKSGLIGGEGKGFPVNVWLISSDGKRYLPGLDADGHCACTSDVAALRMQEGESVTINATFAAPTAESVTVVLGSLATFKNIKVTR